MTDPEPTVDDVDEERRPTVAQPIAAEVLEERDESAPATPDASPATGLDVRRPELVGRPIPGTDTSIVPAANELAGLAQLAVTLSAAAIVPAALRNKPNDVMLVLLTARDVGVALTTALREFHVIDGKVTLSPKVKLAMVKAQGIGKVYPHQPPRTVVVRGKERRQLCPCGSENGANDDTGATWHAERADEPGILHSSTFDSVDAARPTGRNALLGKDNWQNYPQRMMSWRALGYLLDDVFPEVGTGLYSPDELGAITDADGEPVIDVVGSAKPIAGTSAPRGHRNTTTTNPGDAPAPEEALAELVTRIRALPAAAQAALKALWVQPNDAGEARLPKLEHLATRQLKNADALVASIEQRHKRGEWADPAPDAGDEEPASTPQEPATPPADVVDAPEEPAAPVDDLTTATRDELEDLLGSANETVREAAALELDRRDDVADAEAAKPPAPDPRTRLIESVKRMTLNEVRYDLDDLGMTVPDEEPTARAVLTARYLADVNLADDAVLALVEQYRRPR